MSIPSGSGSSGVLSMIPSRFAMKQSSRGFSWKALYHSSSTYRCRQANGLPQEWSRGEYYWDLHLTTGEVSDEMKKSLPDTLKMIMDHLGETYKVGSPQYVEALKNIAGGSRQMQ